MTELPKSQPKKTYEGELESEIVMVKMPSCMSFLGCTNAYDERIANFLEITNLFLYGENQEEAVMLRTFPFSLSGEAKTWMNELDEGTITSWNELREAFISCLDPNERNASHLLQIQSNQRHNNSNILSCFRQSNTRIFLNNTPNEAFKILEDKVFLKLDFLDDSQNEPKSKTVVLAGGSNVNSDHEILMKKFEALATKIDFEFLIIRRELEEILPKISTEEMMKEWMANQMEANERIKNQVVELEQKINQVLRNHQAIIENLERQDHEIKPIPTVPNPKLVNSNSPTVSPFLMDYTMYIPYSNVKTFTDGVLTNHVGGEEFKSIGGNGTERITKKKIENDDNGVSKEPNREWKLNEKVVRQHEEVYHYLWHPTQIPHLNRIIKES
nr:hypothetical protein [Tanacetum cinerariifolium]